MKKNSTRKHLLREKYRITAYYQLHHYNYHWKLTVQKKIQAEIIIIDRHIKNNFCKKINQFVNKLNFKLKKIHPLRVNFFPRTFTGISFMDFSAHILKQFTLKVPNVYLILNILCIPYNKMNEMKEYFAIQIIIYQVR